MDSVIAFFGEMLVLYVIALIGFLARKTGVLNENANGVLTQVVLYITLPALILFSLDISFSVTFVKEFIWLITMSLYILTMSIFIARWMSKRSILAAGQTNVYEGLIIFGNQGFIGYAVSFIILGEEGIIYLTIFNICYLILIWTYGIYLFTTNEAKPNVKAILLNPGILSTLLGLFVFVLPISFPEMITDALEDVGKMTIPLSMIIIGSLIANIKFTAYYQALKNRYLWNAVLVRLLMIPLLLLPFMALSVPFTLLFIAVLVSGMPAAPTISLYAQKYGADTSFASLGVVLSTILCLFTIPILYWVVIWLYA
ncbi:AEC family transporter [Virgibacillus dakarensis]|uniref:Permease n=1 Tax=Lentibacillus populi TaxID=1827502 RepID=A0A9W5U1N6_9BACI|nr:MULTISPECIES: AEC family transporter [Bacillaceae]MBT2214610.1 AEC family transporter [Virgibacillus dakarensis]MTW87337.1 AEC family transporter [Virgibacillus dakarensis]GGB61228.1 permease [Lentibacillus populi]